jgi:hypothetical protein
VVCNDHVIVLAWRLSNALGADFCVEPLEEALARSQSVTTEVSRRQLITGGVDNPISNRL